MNTQHTPGKWRTDGALDNLKVISIKNESSYHLVAEVRCFGHHVPNYAEAEANARLIAAAPELLSTLQQLYSSFQHTEGNDKGNQAKTDVILHNPDVKAALNNTMKLLSKIK